MWNLNQLLEEMDDEDDYQVEEHVSPEPGEIPPLRRPTFDLAETTVQSTFIPEEATLTIHQQRLIQAAENWRRERDERFARLQAEERQERSIELGERRRRGENLLSRIRMPAYRQLEHSIIGEDYPGTRTLSDIPLQYDTTRRVRPHAETPPTPIQIATLPVPEATSRRIHIEEEPTVVDRRPVEPTINFEGFNSLCAQVTNPEDQVRLCFEGTFMGAHYPVAQNAVVPLDDMTYTMDVDAFSVLSYEIPLPEGQPLSMFILANLTLCINRNRQIYYLGQSIHMYQNIHLANFGYTGRFKTNIFFPRLGESTHLMHPDVQNLFVDQVLLPALMQTVQPEYATNIPSSIEVERYRATRRAGRYSFDAFYFYPRNAQATLASTMRDIININPELHGLKDFFFLTYTYGNKYRLDQQNYDQQLRLHFDDLNFDLFDLNNVFVDIGLQFARPGSTGLWTLNERTSPLLPLYFNIINRSNRYLRLDVFANNHNLGGCSYTTHRIEGNGRYNLMKFQCYHLLKSLFYLRTESGYRHNAFDLTPRDFLQNPTRVLQTFQALITALQQSKTRTFPARAEFTLRYEDAIELLANAQHEAMQILSQQPPVMTVLSTTIVVDYLANMVNGYSALYQSLCNQADIMHEQKSLSSLALLAYLYSGLLSRPFDWSVWRQMSRYLNRVRSNRSEMFQLTFTTLNFDQLTRRWLLRDDLPMENLRAIFVESLRFIDARNRHVRADPRVRRPARSASPEETNRRILLRRNVVNRPEEVEAVNREEEDVTALPFALLGDPFNPLQNQLYIDDPVNAILPLRYAPMVYEMSRHPFRTYINMLQVHGNNIRVVDTLINALMWQLFNNIEAPIAEAYLNQGRRSTDVELEFFQDEPAFYRFFNRERVKFRRFFSLTVLNVLFPSPATGDIQNLFLTNDRKSKAIRLTSARQAYLYWQINLIQAGRLEEAEELQLLFFQRMLSLVRFVPAMRPDRQWLRYDLSNGQHTLYFYRNPYYKPQ
ncbi:hypothetical protein EDC96DRAFT_591459 [Choanephora cucurbitarum]|nr:hypothetical protein EDC96DRAFT_591459 [Choanephora cucurbitarum]